MKSERRPGKDYGETSGIQRERERGRGRPTRRLQKKRKKISCRLSLSAVFARAVCIGAHETQHTSLRTVSRAHRKENREKEQSKTFVFSLLDVLLQIRVGPFFS
jgi:hypothetical protein